MARVQIYTTDYCGYCRAAKALLKQKKVEFTEIDLTHDPEKRQSLEVETGMRTVPMIFINDQCIGGFQELAKLDQTKDLDKLLQKG